MTDTERSAIEAAVTAELQAFIEGGNARDAALQTSMFDPEASFVDANALYQGHAAIQEYLEGFFSNFQTWEAAWDELNVDAVRPDLALFFAQVTISRRLVDGRLQETNPFVWLTGRSDLTEAGWKVTHMHLSGGIRTVQN
jgi:ketosteroid isomerase-like protein